MIFFLPCFGGWYIIGELPISLCGVCVDCEGESGDFCDIGDFGDLGRDDSDRGDLGGDLGDLVGDLPCPILPPFILAYFSRSSCSLSLRTVAALFFPLMSGGGGAICGLRW